MILMILLARLLISTSASFRAAFLSCGKAGLPISINFLAASSRTLKRASPSLVMSSPICFSVGGFFFASCWANPGPAHSKTNAMPMKNRDMMYSLQREIANATI